MILDMRSIKIALLAAVAAFICSSASAQMQDLKQVSSSKLVGISFDDPPFQLPLDRNFQMALLTVSTELERTCGRMEAYGWKVDKSSQMRVDKIFKSAIDRLRSAGYTVAPEKLKQSSDDITVYTADRYTADTSNKHFVFLWSAGDRGLVLNICETDGPLAAAARNSISPSVEVFSLPKRGVAPPRVSSIWRGKSDRGASSANFSPVGTWVGGYTCHQGYTGGTMKIKSLKGEEFKGTFLFYPTDKNRNVPSGSYEIYGQYDKDSKRILINPGNWIKKPGGYFNTVVVGRFDPDSDTFSSFFQGISGCTSFEAHRDKNAKVEKANTKTKKKAKRKSVKKQKKTSQALTVDQPPGAAPISDVVPLPPLDDKKVLGIEASPSAIVPAPIATTTTSVMPSPVVPLPVSSPPSASAPPEDTVPLPPATPPLPVPSASSLGGTP